MKESPRFLVSVRKFDIAKRVLNKIALCNKRPRFLYGLEGEGEHPDKLKYKNLNSHANIMRRYYFKDSIKALANAKNQLE